MRDRSHLIRCPATRKQRIPRAHTTWPTQLIFILGPEPNDAGRMGIEEEAEVMERKATSDLDQMRDACFDPPPPRVYFRVLLSVVGEGTAVLIISPLAIESRAERLAERERALSLLRPHQLSRLRSGRHLTEQTTGIAPLSTTGPSGSRRLWSCCATTLTPQRPALM
eukprot:6194282-Pleurochrysis_carterae.AAC.1